MKILLLLLALQHDEKLPEELQRELDDADALMEREKYAEARVSLEAIYEKHKKEKSTGHAAASALTKLAILDYHESKKDADRKEKLLLDGVEKLRAVAKDYPKCGLRGISMFNAGVFLCDFLAKYEEAIKEFKGVIESDVDDKDETGMLMSPFRNYRYNSWRMIATCHAKTKRWPEAVDAALRSRRAYVSHCGTCLREASGQVETRTREFLKDWLGDKVTFDIDGFGDKFETGDAFLAQLAEGMAKQGAKEVAKKLVEESLKAFPDSKPLKDARDRVK